MLIDTLTEFCDSVSAAAAAGTALLGNQIDLGAAAINPGRGQVIYLVINVEVAFASGGSATVDFQLASDAAAAIATNGSATVHFSTGAIPVADLVVGYRQIVALPQGINYERYLGLLCTTAIATTTAGTISAFLTLDPQNYHAYPDAVN